MAIKVSGTEVVSDSRQLTNITGIDATTQSTFESSLDLNNRAVGTVTGNATLDLSTGTMFEHTPTAETSTLVFSNPPASGTGYSFDLKITGVGDATYDLENAVKPYPVGTVNIAAQGFAFSPDGTKFYGGDAFSVIQYELSIPFVPGSATQVNSITLSEYQIGLFFSSDGTKMFAVDFSTEVYQYDLSTAWDITTATYTHSFSAASQVFAIFHITFSSTGTDMYLSDGTNVYQYSLSTAWDISTASYLRSASTYAGVGGIFFKSDGTKLFIYGWQGNGMEEHTLSTAWDISTSTSSPYTMFTPIVGQGYGLHISSDGTKLFLGVGSPELYTFTLSTAWDSTTITFDTTAPNSFSVSAQDIDPTGIFFKPDGTKMYIVGNGGDDVNEYNLSTAWDIETASYLQNFSVNSQDTAPTDIFFKPDGTKMYIVGGLGDDVNEYDLSTAWDISTASYLQNFSVSSQETGPSGIFFKPDGTKMYIVGATGDDVNEYNLSTAWDVTTATYVQNFSVSSQETNPSGVFFKSDGTKMYIVGSNSDSVNEYSLSTAWDVSTASYSLTLSVSNLDTNPRGLFFKSDGTAMYLIGASSDTVWQFSTGFTGLATFTYPASVSWLDASAPSDPADGEVLSLQFFTTDGGTTYYGSRNGAVAELSTQTATTTSTTQTAIASYPTASYDAVKVVITVDDGTDRTTTEMVVTWKGTTAYSTEYATVNTGAAALATFDADVSGSNFRILATPAASTSTSFTVKAITV